jgi:NAD(P)H-hydrate epimerase
VFCGPGNNGGDGLVIARHLKLFGFSPKICVPKISNKFADLISSLKKLEIDLVENYRETINDFHLIIDAIFGFGFSGKVRFPFDEILDFLGSNVCSTPIISIDVPSGWDVENGRTESLNNFIDPEMLISLTLPKNFAKTFKKTHYLCGRFLFPELIQRFSLKNIPIYSGNEQFIILKN